MAKFQYWTMTEHRVAATDLSTTDVARVLKRSVESVQQYRIRNGLQTDPREWTCRQDELLGYYPLLGLEDLHRILPEKNIPAIRYRLVALGYWRTEDNYADWSDAELELLRNSTEAAKYSRAACRGLFGRARDVIYRKLQELGLPIPEKRMDVQALDRASILRGVLSGVTVQDIRDQHPHVRGFVVSRIAREYAEYYGIPLRSKK